MLSIHVHMYALKQFQIFYIACHCGIHLFEETSEIKQQKFCNYIMLITEQFNFWYIFERKKNIIRITSVLQQTYFNFLASFHKMTKQKILCQYFFIL